jgi:hypothetical protein
VKADDYFQPLFSKARRVASPREYRLGGTFLGFMALVPLALDGFHGWAAALAFGIPAIGSFRLARRIEETGSVPEAGVTPNQRLEPTRRKD